MKLWAFRILWGIDLLIVFIVVVFFFIGIADGSVSSFNIGLWFLILFILALIIGGGLWLKKNGYVVLSIILLLVPAIPGLLYALFIVLVVVTDTPWN